MKRLASRAAGMETVEAPEPVGCAETTVPVDGAEVPVALVKETDESFQVFVSGAVSKKASEFWAAKYEADALEEESWLDLQSRLDREGVRYRNVESMMEEAAGDEWDDLDRARSGAIARRNDILRFKMTRAEQLAYKPLRT